MPDKSSRRAPSVRCDSALAAQSAAPGFQRRLLWSAAAAAVVGLVSLGALAKLGALPGTGDGSSTTSAAAVSSSAAPRAVTPAAVTTATPRLSKEYIYAGSRMLAVEDAVPQTRQPIGLLDSAVLNRRIRGWSLDHDDPNASNRVHIYFNGPAGSGTMVGDVAASEPRPDVNAYLGVEGSHGYSFPIPPEYLDGQTHSVYVYGIDTGADAPALLSGSPKSFLFALPTDLVVWRPANGGWYVRDSGSAGTAGFYYGAQGDKPVPADFDGDGLYDFCLFRVNAADQGEWYIQTNAPGGPSSGAVWGIRGDIPVPADYDGDGRADIAVYRPSNKTFYISQSSTNAPSLIALTNDGTPVPADYDGDGRADPATFRLAHTPYSLWTIRRSSDNQEHYPQWGDAAFGDKPVPGDYNGDGQFDLAIWRVQTNEWYIFLNGVGHLGAVVTMPIAMEADDVPVVGDYDADGKTDLAVWRPLTGTWYIRQSSKVGQPDEMRVEQWGANGDKPVPAPMTR